MNQRNLPVVAGLVRRERDAPRQAEPPRCGTYFAQLMGQDGQKRGLKGGPAVLDRARTAYLGAEWSGGGDRRTQAGRVAHTEI